ncbi:uncharacterized protein BXZ73DRAFT_96868 [Epithele typhae]|uniref:uncharacterized protein n=1 Tax=Epithele typhae TaxID=378194 RepID=UPI00200824FE|nr:uncharacterized protein BXZ73DRAFT_96868 [Epithele typhae]KAH9944380.1 hypothetical protein BXZ73DRAFT_96868 [Epithele typhae]
MGFSGLVRWTNAPTTGLELIAQNITKNHQGLYRGKWQLHMKSFRSTLGSVPGFQVPVERSMCTLTMDDNVFCVLEDPAAPMRADYLAQAAEFARAHPDGSASFPPPTHFRHTFPTLVPPMALEQLLTQLRARWAPVRSSGGGGGGSSQGSSSQSSIVEYVPLPVMEEAFDMQPVLTNLLLSILPNVPDPRIVAMTLGEWQWAEVQWDTEEDLEKEAEEKKARRVDEDDIYVADGDHPPFKKGDWIGMDRDRRSAYLIINVLKQEGLL